MTDQIIWSRLWETTFKAAAVVTTKSKSSHPDTLLKNSLAINKFLTPASSYQDCEYLLVLYFKNWLDHLIQTLGNNLLTSGLATKKANLLHQYKPLKYQILI